MKSQKEFSNIKRIYYGPEIDHCVKCGGGLKRSHTKWRKPIQFLSGAYYIINQAYRCACATCRESWPQVYSSVYADGLSLAYQSYGLEVIVYIGNERLRNHKTMAEIHDALVSEYGLQISARHVQNLYDEYLVLSACSHGQRLAKYRPAIEANGGIVLAIDGAKPEKGQPGLYLFRDAASGCRLHCALLPSADQETLSQELKVVKALGFAIQAVISDDERATVAAVADVFPDVPHGLCHIHFLKAVQKPIYEKDQQLAKVLKQPIRALSKVERVVKHQPEALESLSSAQHQALRRYLDALRGVLLTKGQAPFRLAGATIYEALNRLTASLERSLDEQTNQILHQLKRMAETHQSQQALYERVLEQQAWFLGLAELLHVPVTETAGWSTLAGVEVAQDVHDYLDSLALLQDDLPDDAPLFDHMRRRLAEWAPGLFWTYDLHALPRTNNDMETDIGNLKEQYRRTTGRRSLKDYLMRYGPYLAFDDENDDPEELLLWFQDIDRKTYLCEKEKLDALREHLRNIHRFRSDPDDFLAETERLWADSS